MFISEVIVKTSNIALSYLFDDKLACVGECACQNKAVMYTCICMGVYVRTRVFGLGRKLCVFPFLLWDDRVVYLCFI